MNKTTLTALLSITILTSVIAINNISPAFADPTLNPQNGHYYEYLDWHNNSWSNAKDDAERFTYNNIKGHLVTITSQSENDFVTDLIPENNYAWLGLTDKDTEGEFIWESTGNLANYTNWDSSQPNNRYGEEHYAEISEDTGKWNDSRDIHNLIAGYVVEYSD